MSCLVISDIFGRTQALESLSRELEMSFEILDPYSGRYMGFASQE